MATNYDIAFLRVAMRNVDSLEKSSAMRCLQVIDEQGKQGRTLSAMQVAVGMGLLGEDVAMRVDAQTRQELTASGAGVLQSGASAVQSGAYGAVSPYSSATFRSGAGAPPPPPPLPDGSPSASGSIPAQTEWYDLSLNGEGLDDFQLGPKLGRGPVGATYRGRKKTDASDVIVKVISRRFQQHDGYLQQITAHLESWMKIQHPQLSDVVALGSSNGRNVVVYRVAAGQSLDRVIEEEGPLPPSKALRVIYEIGQVLAEAERQGIAHGDVRAEKVYFNGRSAFLVDPGLARASALASGFGQHGLAFGHPNYMAPEVLQEHRTDPSPQADVYALGILFYFMVCGKLPFSGEPLEVLTMHFESPLPPPPPEVTFSTTIAGLILKMTAKAPTQRLSGPQELVESINRLLQGKPMFPPPTRVAEPMSADDWGRVSHQDEHTRVSQDWTTSKIEKVAPVGPSSLGELDAYATQDSARLPVEKLSPAQAHGLTLGTKLGRGTVGSCYEGTMGGKPVVIKVVSKRFAKYPDLLRRIMKCVGAAGALDHPNIVRAFKALRGSEGRELIVYERAVGNTLRAQLENGPLRVSAATLIISQLAEALATAGARGVSHGDIRPEKIFVEPAGRVRLADFGLAEAACLGAGYGKNGMHFGHPRYLAPEALQEGLPEPTPKTDVYALGILYYELVCGRPPFEGPGTKETLKQHLEAAIPPPPQEVTVPGEVAEVILRMTAKDPKKRLSSPVAVAQVLEPLMGMDVSRETSAVQSNDGAPIQVSEFMVDEFDPTMQSDPMSADAWGAASEQVARPSGEWDRKRIEDAPKVGPAPDEWEPETMSDEGGRGDDATLSAAIQQATLEAAIGKTNLKTRKKGGKKGAKKGDGGTGKSKLPMVAAVGGGVLLLAVIGVVIATSDPGNGGTTGSTTSSSSGSASGGTTGTKPPRTDGLDPVMAMLKEGKVSEAEQTFEGLPEDVRGSPQGNTVRMSIDEAKKKRRVADELAVYLQDTDALIGQGEWKQAYEKDVDLTEETAKSPQGARAIDGKKKEIRGLVDAKYLKEKRAIEQLAEEGKHDDALQRVEAMRPWMLDPRSIDTLRQWVVQQRDARWRPLIDSGRDFSKIKKSRVKAKLKTLLGRNVDMIWDRGQFYVKFPPERRPGKQLVLALQRVPLKRGQGSIRSKVGEGLRVDATKGPVLLQLNAPLHHVHELVVHLETAEPLEDEGRVTLLVGAKKGSLRSGGMVWGVVPVQMRANGMMDMVMVDPPQVKQRKPIVLTLLTQKRGKQVTIQGTQQVDTRAASQSRGKKGLKGKADSVAIYFEDIQVTIKGLEFSGVVDPKGLE